VTLKSELGRGSTFTVRLPLHIQEETRLEFDLSPDRLYAGVLPADAGRVWGQESAVRSQESPVAGQQSGDADNGKPAAEGNGVTPAPAANQPSKS
jgi:hypothetical protein